ncbi:MAG: hypothetical protein D6689_21920 [Deltaproteobacteria bacterium]|nr:MAG: hypothetical protein D6689_21920 [Deltaproteobacteria bacterium]
MHAAAACAAAACGGASDGAARGRAAVAVVPADSDRFPHGLHTGDDPRIAGYRGRGLQCADCHPADAVARGEVARPGANDHAPCDECHRDEFYRPPGRFCLNCHAAVEPRERGATTLQPYPERGTRKVLAARFSHQLHLDAGAMDRRVGFHVACGDCHARAADARDPALPGHAECARCHGDGKPAAAAAALRRCDACHPTGDVALERGRQLITGDLVFAHATHERDAAGAPIPCATCHADVPRSRSNADVSVPPMQQCATCHEDASRTPERVRIAHCDVCHTAIAAGVPPRSHMVGKGMPDDHTLAFRTDHARAAADPEARCAYCHDGLSGSPRDSCFQCHDRMRPRDHGMGWRDRDHGREAAADRDRCQTCHAADWCAACHSIPPRSHQPMAEFRLGGHAQEARFGLSSCFACHTFEDTCSDCHRGQR